MIEVRTVLDARLPDNFYTYVYPVNDPSARPDPFWLQADMLLAAQLEKRWRKHNRRIGMRDFKNIEQWIAELTGLPVRPSAGSMLGFPVHPDRRKSRW